MSGIKPDDSQQLYVDGCLYDLENKYFVEDVPFYLEQAGKFGGPVLELACGTGRITIPLAEKGFEIVGIDLSPPMLERARKKAAEKRLKIEWIEADCRTFKLQKKFNLIFIPYNSIAHIHDRESHEALFACVKKHLADDGRFVIDWFNPRLDILLRDAGKRYSVMERSNPDGSGMVTITENNVYDAASQINRIKWYYKFGDRDEVVRELNMRILYPQELDALLHYNGFTIEAKYGNYDESPFESSSIHQLVVSRHR
ncbi:MAG: class I SAM-dependent methyltransferase [candidate division Zixibacteria bacterium]|nr:class I SAM-dependent methyltransferase [candidate division Zixibacteria bacterium]